MKTRIYAAPAVKGLNAHLAVVHCLGKYSDQRVIKHPFLRVVLVLAEPQQTRGIHLMMFQCWASVEDGGPTLKQHRVNDRVCWDVSRSEPTLYQRYTDAARECPANTRHWPSVG